LTGFKVLKKIKVMRFYTKRREFKKLAPVVKIEPEEIISNMEDAIENELEIKPIEIVVNDEPKQEPEEVKITVEEENEELEDKKTF
jgi:hypothetical protein